MKEFLIPFIAGARYAIDELSKDARGSFSRLLSLRIVLLNDLLSQIDDYCDLDIDLHKENKIIEYVLKSSDKEKINKLYELLK